MKYLARVTGSCTGIHTLGTFRAGRMGPVATIPVPTRVEIELNGSLAEPCMTFRYSDVDGFCGDTWRENLEQAFVQADLAYGLRQQDFAVVADEPQ